MNTRLLIIGAIACAIPFSSAAQTTQRLSASKANEYGLIYSLPVTDVDITIETEHTRLTPGEFYNYARRHLAINDAITTASTSVAVKSITINTRGTADPDNRWIVQFKSGSTPFITLDSEGKILSVNEENTAIAASPTLPQAVAAEPTALETAAARQAMTQEMIRSSSTPKRAELAAQRIFELREMRSDILSGQAENPPADGQAMQLVLDNLAGQEAALTAMFAGTEQKWTTVSTVTLRPDTLGLDDEIIARISPFDGVLAPDNLAGAPLTASIEVVERGKLPVNEKGEVKKFPKGGLAYTIPGKARITIAYEGRTIATAELPIAQLGVTFGIDPALFIDKKAPATATFDPTTGGITKIGSAL